jgi:Helix-turn-helix domain
MTSPARPAGTGLPDHLADGAAGERGTPGHGLLHGRDAASAGASPVPGTADGPASASVAGLAAQLRELRESAGRPSYRRLAQLTHYSHTTLSQAAAGHSLPSLAVTQAFVRACGGDVEEWSARWREVGQVIRLPGEPPCPPPQGPARADSRWHAAAGGLRAGGMIAAAAGVATAACVTAVMLWTAGPATMAGMPGRARPLLRVESSGLHVRYAAVTNLGTRAGYAYVLNTGAGRVHRSPRPVPPGQSWTYFFNRDLKNGAQICGFIALGPATCAGIHAAESH